MVYLATTHFCHGSGSYSEYFLDNRPCFLFFFYNSDQEPDNDCWCSVRNVSLSFFRAQSSFLLVVMRGIQIVPMKRNGTKRNRTIRLTKGKKIHLDDENQTTSAILRHWTFPFTCNLLLDALYELVLNTKIQPGCLKPFTNFPQRLNVNICMLPSLFAIKWNESENFVTSHRNRA